MIKNNTYIVYVGLPYMKFYQNISNDSADMCNSSFRLLINIPLKMVQIKPKPMWLEKT
jgi:hypothetical protein